MTAAEEVRGRRFLVQAPSGERFEGNGDDCDAFCRKHGGPHKGFSWCEVTPNDGVTGAASPRTVDAVLAEIQASADLAWEHAQQQEAAGNTVRAEWFKGRSVGLGEAAQAIRKANARLDRPETAGKEDCRGD